MKTLDRYVLRQFVRIFGVCVLGVPFLFIVIRFTDEIDSLLQETVTGGDVFMHYILQFPYHMLLAFPIACLIATVFTVSNMTRHFEMIAAKAGGISFYRVTAPLLLASAVISLLALGLTEVIPDANQLSDEMIGEDRSQGARLRFVYRGNGRRYYTIERLTTSRGEIEQLRIDFEGQGYEYPPYVVDAPRADWDSAAGRWVVRDGTLRILPERGRAATFQFAELHQRGFSETPEDLLAPPKDEDNMDYAELSQYIDALERSGSDTKRLRVERALRIAFPFACFIIALFGAPLANSSRQGGASVSVGIALVTTLLFLMFTRIAEALGAGGALPPVAAAWLPNALFLFAGLYFYRKAPT